MRYTHHTTTIGVVAGFFCSNRNFRLKFRFQTRLTIVYAEEKRIGAQILTSLFDPSPHHTTTIEVWSPVSPVLAGILASNFVFKLD